MFLFPDSRVLEVALIGVCGQKEREALASELRNRRLPNATYFVAQRREPSGGGINKNASTHRRARAHPANIHDQSVDSRETTHSRLSSVHHPLIQTSIEQQHRVS